MAKTRRSAVLGLIALLTAGLTACTSVPAAAPESPSPSPPASAPAAGAATPPPQQASNIRHVALGAKRAPFDQRGAWNSDLAFQGNHAFVGNYGGFTVYDIADPARPRVVSQVVCPASQNDISVSGKLLFLSVDEPRTGESCESADGGPGPGGAWEGIRIFDISDVRQPRFVAAVRTDCGSHTHTLLPDGDDVYVYVSSYGPQEGFTGCEPPHDKISIIRVPRDDPAAAKVVATPVLFKDGGQKGNLGPFDETSGCHDITVYPEKRLAAGACMGDGILLDISKPAAPRVLDRVQDTENFAFWHSATFNNEADRVVFTDELGGGTSAVCTQAIGPKRGADGVYDIVGEGDGRRLRFRGYFKIPRHQEPGENCVAHNGNLVPAKGRDIMVQAWYQGGVSVFDFTDPENVQEIGYFDRAAFRGDSLAGSWSAYYYNGHVYSSDIQHGLDVLKITHPSAASAESVRTTELNAQTQTSYKE
ncbi:LVIVD repeat-containing protein [Bailinhaonella thermotolerans]|uniref:LVIVD repeat-containing protein n=1 Tax=Bailinhaonella thermotolerans TaxID=1070861 RepID=UPI001F5B1907|nr:hypothetical protein [Bailinhaonella thermotolerans]